MRHGNTINNLGRTASHRKALLSNMATSLILNKRITTTVAKAKALRKYVEPLITKAKNDTTHSRRTVFAYLQNKESVKALFGEVASKVSDRPGGYTRIIKMAATRLGDNAEVCLIELVDFNTLYTKDAGVKKAKTRRSRSKKSEEVDATDVEATSAEAADATEKNPKKAKAAKKSEEKDTDKPSDTE